MANKIIESLWSLADKIRTPIFGEMGISEDSLFRRFNLFPYSPDKLITRKGFEIYEEMLKDDQIYQAVTARKTMLLSADWSVEPASEDEHDVEISDFCTWVLREFVEGTFNDDLWEIASAGEFGWSLGEKVWAVIEHGEHKGKIGLKAYKSKNVRDYNIFRDEHDNIKEFGIVRITAPQTGQTFPKSKFVLYSYRKRNEDVFGTSILRSLYDLWWLKHILKRAWGVSFERGGVPAMVGKYPRGMKKADQEKLFTLVKSMRFESALVIPKEVELTFADPGRQSKDVMLDAIKHINEQFVITILGQTTTQSQGERGSESLGFVHKSILGMVIEEFGNDMSDKAVNEQIIKDMVDFNFPNVTNYPKFGFKSAMPSDESPRVTAFLNAVEKKAVKVTGKDETEIRRILKFPERKEEDSLLNDPLETTPAQLRPFAAPGGAAPPNKEGGPGPTQPEPQAGENPDPDDEDAEKLQERIFTGVRRRSFTKAEERMDFQEILRTIEEDGVEDMLQALGPILTATQEDLLAQVQRQKIMENLDTKAVEKLKVRNVSDIRAVLKTGLDRTVRKGQRSAKKDISKARKEIRMAEPTDVSIFLPKEVQTLFNNRAFTAAGIIRDDVLGMTKRSLSTSIRNGLSFRDAASGVRKVLNPFVKSGIVDEAAASGPRLETIVRTNTVDAFNLARREEFRANSDFVPGLQYSAILDDRVRDSHAKMDGNQYATDDPIWDTWTPPNGFNCRCVIVPITLADGDFVASKKPPVSVQPDKGFKEDGS